MKNLIIIILLSTCISVSAQNSLEKPQTIKIFAGRSFHGTGDIYGLSYGAEYSKYWKNRFSWKLGFSGSIHDKEHPLFYSIPPPFGNNEQFDGSQRSTTAGVQIQGLACYNFIKGKKHLVSANLGLILRYQSTSIVDDLTIWYPAATNFPVPLYQIINTEPSRTYAIGGIIQLEYKYQFSKNYFIGLQLGFQVDSNGDVLRPQVLTFGRRFN